MKNLSSLVTEKEDMITIPGVRGITEIRLCKDRTDLMTIMNRVLAESFLEMKESLTNTGRRNLQRREE